MGEIVRIADAVKPKTFNKQAKVKLAQDLLAEKSVCRHRIKCASLIAHLYLQKDLTNFALPLDPTFRVKSVECIRVMDSKKLPLWLKFTSSLMIWF